LIKEFLAIVGGNEITVLVVVLRNRFVHVDHLVDLPWEIYANEKEYEKCNDEVDPVDALVAVEFVLGYELLHAENNIET